MAISPRIVGRYYAPAPNKKKTKFTYKFVIPDAEGWVNPKEFLPLQYDLVTLRLENKTLNGWYTGTYWEGLHYKDGSEVLAWKRELIDYTKSEEPEWSI